MPRTQSERWWALWLAGGCTVAAAFPLLPMGLWRVLVSWLVPGAVCVVMIRRARRQSAPTGWYLCATGVGLMVLGEVLFAVQHTLGPPPYPSWADASYLAAYPVLTVALFLLTRQRGPIRTGTLVDSAIVAVGVGIVYLTLVLEPVITDTSVPVLERTVTAAYPATGVVLCAVTVPMLLRRESRTPSMWLLTAGSALIMACNAAYTLAPGFVSEFTAALFTGYILAHSLWGAAALHPSAGQRPQAQSDHFGRGRLLVLTGSMLLVPAMLVVQGHRDAGRGGWIMVAFGSMALFVLVAVRLWGYITRVDAQAAQLRRQATLDDLTGLPNRREFERLAARTVDKCQVVMLDLAGFRHINDRLGRAVGDQALVAVAALLRDSVREGDLVARMGADEFGVLVRDARPGEANAVAARIADLVRHPVHAGEHELLLSARLGVSAGTGTVAAAELVRRADTARYAAKSSGNNLVVYTPALDERAEADERLGADLRHSLEDGDFFLVYQPIVELRDGRTVAVEALIRWVHPVRGFVTPDAFIPVAEDNGLIVELGEWVMRTACRQFATWRRELGAEAPRYVSVNVSARQLSEPGFPAVVAGILAECGLEPQVLLVEVTETAIFGGGVAIEAVEALHSAGVLIALDDFGTGHSSLGLLRTVPVDVLKVDKSFVDEIIDPARRAVIVDALIHVSDGLGLRAVAEGVETAEQAGYLREIGYHYGQGYYFGKPVPHPFGTGSARQAVPAVGQLLGQPDRQ